MPDTRFEASTRKKAHRMRVLGRTRDSLVRALDLVRATAQCRVAGLRDLAVVREAQLEEEAERLAALLADLTVEDQP